MDKEQKTLKSPLSAKNTINPLHCEECKAKAAGEAQKSLANEVLSHLDQIDYANNELKKLIKEVIG